MFDFIRNHNKAIQIGLMALVLPGFFLFGIDGFNKMGDKSETVAIVAGQKIGQIEWDAAVKEDVDMERRRSPNIDPKVFDSSEFKYRSLERLVAKRVIATAARHLHLAVSDQSLAAELLKDPALAALRKPDGKVDEARYKELLAPQGLTPEGYEAKVRADLSVQQVFSSLAKSVMSPASVADAALNAYFERRDIQTMSFSPVDYAAQLKPTDAEIEAFYKSNTALFQTSEKATVEYVVLDVQSIRKTITLNDADIKAYYDQNVSRLSGTEERKASHILLTVAKSASASERDKAKKLAEDVLAQAKKSPATFAELAKKYSQDTVSAANGGDLGFFAKGSMVKPFEDAVFAMQTKQISEVVESDFGYHIIQLNEIKAPKTKSFVEMRPTIELELTTQQAQKKYAEAAELFTNMVYEQSDSLKPVADKLKLEIKVVQDVARTASPDARGPLANSKFLNALFSADALDKKRNTEAVDLGAGQIVAGRMQQYTPIQTKPFAEVQSLARSLLMARLSADVARKEGAAKLAELLAQPTDTPTTLGASMTVSRDATAAQPAKVVDAALRANAGKLPQWVGVDLGADGYRVIRVNKIVDGGAVLAAQNRQQYMQLWTSAEGASYYEYLKEKHKVKFLVRKPS